MKNIISCKHNPIDDIYSNNLKRLVNECLEKDPLLRPSINEILGFDYIKHKQQTIINNKDIISKEKEIKKTTKNQINPKNNFHKNQLIINTDDNFNRMFSDETTEHSNKFKVHIF